MTKTNDSFDYSIALKELCRDICARLSEFRRIDVDRMGFGVAKASNRDSKYGGWASMTPLLFEGGAAATVKKRRVRARTMDGRFAVAEVARFFKTPNVLSPDRHTRLLYIFTIMTPRFYNLTVEEKLTTVMHELYHVHPSFNGDIRRFPGRNWQHGSKERYEAVCRKLKDEWLAFDPDPRLYNFLQWNYKQLLERYDRINSWRYRKIKLIEIERDEAIRLNPDLANL